MNEIKEAAPKDKLREWLNEVRSRAVGDNGWLFSGCAYGLQSISHTFCVTHYKWQRLGHYFFLANKPRSADNVEQHHTQNND